jgi:hypothetical protein
MLVEVRHPETDYRDMDPLNALGSQGSGNSP